MKCRIVPEDASMRRKPPKFVASRAGWNAALDLDPYFISLECGDRGQNVFLVGANDVLPPYGVREMQPVLPCEVRVYSTGSVPEHTMIITPRNMHLARRLANRLVRQLKLRRPATIRVHCRGHEAFDIAACDDLSCIAIQDRRHGSKRLHGMPWWVLLPGPP